jgi:hypothetical protein
LTAASTAPPVVFHFEFGGEMDVLPF